MTVSCSVKKKKKGEKMKNVKFRCSGTLKGVF